MSNVQNLVMATPEPRVLAQAGFRDYVAIARFDHMTKHVFIVPGLVLGYTLSGTPASR